MPKKTQQKVLLAVRMLITLVLIGSACYVGFSYYKKTSSEISSLNQIKAKTEKTLNSISKELIGLKNQDQYKINKDLESKIKSIETTYSKAVAAYEKLLDLKVITKKTEKFDSAYADILTLLSKRNYSSAEADLLTFEKDINDEKQKVLASFQIPVNVPESNSPPGSGYQQQVVKSDVGDFLVGIVSADLNSTRV